MIDDADSDAGSDALDDVYRWWYMIFIVDDRCCWWLC